MRICDGGGKGFEAKVNSELQLETNAVSNSNQHHVSQGHSKAFQASATVEIAASKVSLLLITNNDAEDLVVTYIRVMSIGAAAASAGAFFTLEGGGAYTSGGDTNMPVNMNIGQKVVANATLYDGGTAIVVDSEFVEFDRNYEANSMQSYNKDGSLILKQGASLLITHTGSTAVGTAYARVSFYFVRVGK